jgi:poly(hydroxyalkanoate) depolymerase family esterase
MKTRLPHDMLAVTRLTRSGRLGEATAAIRRMLHGQSPTAPQTPATRREAAHLPGILQALLRRTRGRVTEPPAAAPPVAKPPSAEPPSAEPPAANIPAAKSSAVGQFLTHSFTGEAGTRPYKLYVPSGYRGEAVPLVVMLHGCTQSPDDFALGTRMNIAAEGAVMLVAYPGQTAAANSQKCWNWFNPADQGRDGGEPALIAGITHAVMRDYRIDPTRVYIAGLSAGGAAADILGTRYPDLFAAIGVHSGLACGAAHDLSSAFAAMQSGAPPPTPQRRRPVPTIVFHGARDTVVNPRNGQSVVAQALQGTELRAQTEAGRVLGGHEFSRTRHIDAVGATIVEQWLVHGAGHAWSGGDAAGSFTDPKGPDATSEMVRFFLTHRLRIG